MNQQPDTNFSRLGIFIGVGMIALLIGLVVMVVLFKPKPMSDDDLPPELRNNYLLQGKPILGVQMTDHDGQAFTEQNFKQHWSFVFFGFTNCPDVCPTTMLVMKQIWSKLPETAKHDPQPQLLFVTVDPARDTTEKLKPYVTYYHPEFIGVRGEHNQLDILVNQLGALYGYEDGPDEQTYTVNHSAHVLLIDPQGQLRAVFSPPHGVDDMVATFTKIREFYRG